ncbi:MAG: IclR family transcriptional regulator [Gaiellaceae bacterium]
MRRQYSSTVVADTATSLRRGVAVLQSLHSEEALSAGGLGVLRIAELLDCDKSQVSRTLKTLAEYGLVDRDAETRAYRLGWAVFALAARAGDTRLLAAGDPVVRDLSAALGERVHLTVLQGSTVLTVLSESPQHAIQATGWVGLAVPAYCSSSGRALLLDRTREEVRDLFAGVDFVALGPNAPRDADDLYARICDARARAYAVADEEFEPGLVAVAAPVRDFRGSIVAALNVSAPKFRLAARLEDAGEAVAESARRLSGLLGFTSDHPLSTLEADQRP